MDLVIPDIFIDENFDLSNLETFSGVISIGNRAGNSVAVNDVNGGATRGELFRENGMNLFTKNQLKELQRVFTDYLDVIEEKLANQISHRSGDFFQVMTSVDCVMDELSLAIKSVTSLRKKCSNLNNSLIMPNMKTIQMNRTRNNAQMVLDKMNEISKLCKVQPMIQILLSASDFVGALDLIAKSRVMLHQDLNRVVSLRHMESQLVEIERMIGAMMQQEFLTLISSEWDSMAAGRLSKLFDYFANTDDDDESVQAIENGQQKIKKQAPERGSLTLLSLLQIQAEKFVNQFHEERKKRIESALDIEQWKVVPVPVGFQKFISMLVDENAKIGDVFLDFSLNQDQQLDHVETAGSTYVIINSVIILVKTIMDYCKCAHEIRSLSADLLERLFKILQLFNSKTYHLVYSAGAVQVAGLKTITTRSLIVSQRSLRLIVLMIPALHRHFAQLLPYDNRLRRFNEIKSSYEEHATKIPERVKTIVEDVINLQLLEWEARPPVPSAQFSAVAQHLTRLHDNIQNALPSDELTTLFMDLTDTFKRVLIKHLRRLNISNDAGPQQWLVTQELTFYRISLSKLSAFKGVELSFDDVWADLGADTNDNQDGASHTIAPETK